MLDLIQSIRGTARLLYFAVLTIAFLIPIVLRSAIRGIDLRWAVVQRRKFAVFLAKQLGVRVKIVGEPYQGACIYVSNHRSYFDPVVPSHRLDVIAVTKAEVRKWPLIGFGVNATGTIFIQRESSESRSEARSVIADYLADGYSILIYPEGTTHTGATTIDFRPGIFGIAARQGAPIVPMAIEYGDLDDAWVGTESFLPHFIRRFGQPHMEVRLIIGAPIFEADPDQLRERAKVWIDEHLLRLRRELKLPETADGG